MQGNADKIDKIDAHRPPALQQNAYTRVSSSAPDSLGFPTGYFVIRNLATGRLWDVCENKPDDGASVILFREKDASLVENLRDPEADNQVFFVDYSGALCSKPTGNAIDVQDGRLVLRHRRPMTLPFPNPYSHPIPQFAYDPSTGHIHVRFSCDPSYAPPSRTPSVKWRERQYLVTSIPSAKRSTTLFDTATEFIFSSASRFVSGVKTPLTPSLPTGTTEFGEFDLRDEEVMEEERGEEGDVDDSPEDRREMRVLSLPHTAIRDIYEGGSRKARERRRWEIVPILRERVKSRHSLIS